MAITPEEIIANIICGVVGNAVSSLLAKITPDLPYLSKSKKCLSDFNFSDDMSSKISKSLVKVAKEFDQGNEIPNDKFRLFLVSKEVEATIRQIYSVKSLNQDANNNLEAIKNEFTELVKLHLQTKYNIPSDKINELSYKLFEIIVDSCNKAISKLNKNDCRFNVDALSEYRHKLLLDEIAGIKKNLHFFRITKDFDVEELKVFEGNYLKQFKERHACVTPPYLDTETRVPINDIYVSPTLLRYSKKDSVKDVLDYSALLAESFRSIILGNPGGGKSTLSLKICSDIFEGALLNTASSSKLVPILVILRDFGAERKKKKLSILDYIETNCNSAYQIKPPPNAFEYLIRNGKTFIIFDGLDELLDSSFRKTVRDEIESFCNLYPSAQVLVTSRKIGYSQAPLKDANFEGYILDDFDDKSTKDYVRKWFGLNKHFNDEQRNDLISSFMKESSSVPDLRRNPLMLALMCNLYKAERYIPHNRPDLYSKCSEFMYIKWDKSRGIDNKLTFEEHLKPALQHIAFNIYVDATLQKGVTETNLINIASKYLLEVKYETIDEAEHAARDFIEFCKGRAWVFTEVGEAIYQFSHRTFLEYYTSLYLCRIHYNPKELAEILLPKIKKEEWDVVAQLSIQNMYKGVHNAWDIIFDLYEPEMTGLNEQSFNVLSFMCRAMEFIVPKPKHTRKLVDLALNALASSNKIKRKLKGERTNASSMWVAEKVICPLLGASQENYQYISDQIKIKIKEGLQSANNVEWKEFVKLTLAIGSIHIPDEYHKIYKPVIKEIIKEDKVKFELVAKDTFAVYLILFHFDIYTLKELVEWYGIEYLFKDSENEFLEDKNYISIGQSVLYKLFMRTSQTKKESQKVTEMKDILSNIGKYALQYLGRKTKINVRGHQFHLFRIPPFAIYKDGISGIDAQESNANGDLMSAFGNDMGDCIFGIFILFAVIHEISNATDIIHPYPLLDNARRINFYKYIFEILDSRPATNLNQNLELAFKESKFDKEQANFAREWVKGSYSITHVSTKNA